MKKMSNHDKQEMFLNYLKDIYIQNPDFPIKSDTIYNELCKFYVNDDAQCRVSDISLINVQSELANKFSSKFSRGGYFWFTENRSNLRGQDFYDKMHDSIKLYISVDAENIYNIVTKTINFMKDNNIVNQSKVSKILRCDAFVVRVSNMNEADMVMDYVNSLNNKSKIEPNPFLYREGKVSMTRDGNLSYNSTLSDLLEKYLNYARKEETLDNVSVDNFLLYVNKVINDLNNTSFRNNDYLMVLKLIAKNLDGSITKEYIEKYNPYRQNDYQEENYTREDKDKLRYVISLLSNYYDVDTYHKILEKYISTGNVTYFTRRDGIRAIVDNNFSPEKLDVILKKIGKEALYFAVKATNEKYPDINQSAYAIKKFLLDSTLDGFTNNFDARSSLSLLTSKKRLKEIIREEVSPSYIQFFDSLDELTFAEKEAIYKSNYTNFTKEEVSKLMNINNLINSICIDIENNLLQKIEENFDKYKGRRI